MRFRSLRKRFLHHNDRMAQPFHHFALEDRAKRRLKFSSIQLKALTVGFYLSSVIMILRNFVLVNKTQLSGEI